MHDTDKLLRKLIAATALLASAALWWPAPAEAMRLKEVASVQGVRSNQLVGYGLVAVLTRALYARGSWKAPTACVAGGWLLAVVVDVVLAAVLPGAAAIRLRSNRAKSGSSSSALMPVLI